jgi:beta-xylosidase
MAVPTAIAVIVGGVMLLVAFSARSDALVGASPSREGSTYRAAVPTTTSTSTTTTALPPANPAFPAKIITPFQDRPDPFVLVANGGYYLFSSQSANAFSKDIPVQFSTDLEHWGPISDALPVLPAWADGTGTWAPDVRWISGQYVMYFTALVKGQAARTECIGTATATTPAGPFTPSADVLVCQTDHRGSIDPRIFIGLTGAMWLDWKSDDNADVNGTSHTFIYAQRLSSDGLSLIGQSTVILTADQLWEGRIVEAPQMVLWNDHYWLFYSGNWYNQPYYAIGVAECAGPVGPCSKPSPKPFLASNVQGQGPGESSLFSDDNGLWMVYGPWAVQYQTNIPRPVALAHIAFDTSGPYVAAFPVIGTSPRPSPRHNGVDQTHRRTAGRR